MARYHMGWEDEQGQPGAAGGKGVRAGLCLLACQAVGGKWETAVPAAAAVELVHAFSLVHDDIQDRDRERHHRPAVWTVWGEAQAINAGDALLALARLGLAELSGHGVPAEAVLAAGRSLDEATLHMVEGQTLDLQYEEREDVSVEEYMEMVACKSGALFGCALAMGAICGGSDEREVREFGRLGRVLGTAFQVRDDVLGIWGDSARTGKACGADLLRRKKSLPVVVALNGAAGKVVRDAYAGPGEVAVERVLVAMDQAGVRSECGRIGEELSREARELIHGLELRGDAGLELEETVRFVLERDF
jgi:geranylgeranyl diphosphate synthase type I